jgi:hypothetical protein
MICTTCQTLFGGSNRKQRNVQSILDAWERRQVQVLEPEGNEHLVDPGLDG